MPNWQNGHAGIVSFPSGAANSVNELVANQGSDLGGPVFANVQKCMVRWVVLCNGLYSSSSFDGEWHVGLGNPDGFGAMYGGALLSFAPGYPAAGLLAGLYTSISNYTETPTSFTIAPNTWDDLIISWTPEAIKCNQILCRCLWIAPKLKNALPVDESDPALFTFRGRYGIDRMLSLYA